MHSEHLDAVRQAQRQPNRFDPAVVRSDGPSVTVRVGTARGAMLLGVAALLGGCMGSGTGDAASRAEADLAQSLVKVHEKALDVRAADPAAVDAAAAENLGYALTGGNPTFVVSAAVTADGLEVVTMVGVRVETGGGLSYEQLTLGTCVLTSATAGSPAEDVGGRGAVTTESVSCPDGVTPLVNSAPVEATTTELERLESPVPRR